MTHREIVISVPRIGGIRIWRERIGTTWEVVVVDQSGHERSRSLHQTTVSATEEMAAAAAKYVREAS